MTFSWNRAVFHYIWGLILLLILSILHLTQGQAQFTIYELVTQVWEPGKVQDVVTTLRLPRLVIGIAAGMALAVSGAILQTLTKNPLSSPGTLGINAGAYFFVVAAAIMLPNMFGEFRLLIAISGSITSSVLILLLAGKRMEPVRVALTGMIVSLFFSAFTGAFQLLYENETNGLFLWGSGTLLQLGWGGVQFASPLVAVFIVAALFLSKQLDTLSLGEEVAVSLGQKIMRVKIIAWAIAIILSSTLVSIVGPIGFVGLVAPHIAKMLGMKKHLPMFIHSILWGAVLLVGADVIGRWIQPAEEVPVGALTALIGAPWLLYLAWKTAKRTRGNLQSLGGTNKPYPLKYIAPLFVVLSLVVIAVSVSYNGQAWNWDWDSTVIQRFRMPRVLTAFLIGVILAIGGVILQGILRNPLADVSVIGLTSMGGAGGMIVLVLFTGASAWLMPIGVTIGTAFCFMIILIVAWKHHFNPILIALIGISLSALGSAVTQVLTIKAKLTAASAVIFLSGSTYASNWNDVYSAIALLTVITLPLCLLTRYIDMLQFGDDVATGMGTKVRNLRLNVTILAVIQTTVSIMIVGVIGFLGLVAPHIARRLVGYRTMPLLIASSLLGGVLLVAADFIGRVAIAPKDIPSGLVVALIGTPYLIYLLYKLKK